MVAVQDPEDLGRRIEELRTSIVFDDGLTVLSPCAEQHFMLAIAALEQARAHMMLAHYLVMQGK